MVATARAKAHEESLRRLAPLLTAKRKEFLDGLLVPDSPGERTPLGWLRRPATSNSPRALLEVLGKLRQLQGWDVPSLYRAAVPSRPRERLRNDLDGTFGNVRVFLADANVIYKPLSPRGSRRITPFVSAGPGLAYYDADEAHDLPDTNTSFDDATRFVGQFGLGIDIMPNTPTKHFGAFIRIEAVDHVVFNSPAEAAGEASDYGPVHNLSLKLGMNLIFGLQPDGR